MPVKTIKLVDVKDAIFSLDVPGEEKPREYDLYDLSAKLTVIDRRGETERFLPEQMWDLIREAFGFPAWESRGDKFTLSRRMCELLPVEVLKSVNEQSEKKDFFAELRKSATASAVVQ